MSLSSIALQPTWRDYYGMWSAQAEPWLAPLDLSKCHYPRLVVLPEVGFQTFPAGGKIEYNFHLLPGSLIWGLFVPGTSTAVSVQLTDVELEHQFFQEPISTDQICVVPFEGSYFPPFTLLPTPHPVVGDGLFTFEAWGPPASTFIMLLGLAEVSDCQVK